jgi:glucosyl-3-phosphoglycerate phosphatase
VIFFTRHGESVANVADRELRRRPVDADRLSPAGFEQARVLARRLDGQGLEGIVTSPYRRARETGAVIGEALGLPVEVDRDMHELRQADAYYTSAPNYGATGAITWMPRSAPDHAEPGAESFNEIVARVLAVQERLGARAERERLLCVTHWGFLHFFLGVSMFGDAFAPVHLAPLFRISHANTGITVFERRPPWEIDGVAFDGWALHTWNDRGSL